MVRHMRTICGLTVCLIVLNGSQGGAIEPDTKAEPRATSEKAKPVLERLRFVPDGGPWKGEAPFEGAAWHNLRPGLTRGVLQMIARAGVGDTFPVGERDDVIRFNVKLLHGNDDELTVEVRAKEVQKVVLKRDKAKEVTIAGLKYRLLYPTSSVEAAPGEKPSTNKARIIVSRKL
jgi:hypothetical protein